MSGGPLDHLETEAIQAFHLLRTPTLVLAIQLDRCLSPLRCPRRARLATPGLIRARSAIIIIVFGRLRTCRVSWLAV